MIRDKDVLLRLLNALHPGATIYLFGSRARGTNRPNSDIDLAIDAGRQLTIREIGRARSILEAYGTPEKIDVVDMWSIPQDLKEIILKEGIIWSK